ncbi:MAG: hypothetical protein AAGB46_20265 [Verrucomicrobiota bacterium]
MDRDTLKKALSLAFGSLALLSFVFSAGCASGGGYTKVPRTSAGVSHSVELGTIVHVRKVNIEGESSNLGVVSGVGAGAAVGRTVGRGDGSLIAGAAGAVIGGIAGTKIEKAMTAKLAQEVTIESDDGGTMVVVQELQDPEFREGDRVAILETNAGWTRIRHYDEGDQFY